MSHVHKPMRESGPSAVHAPRGNSATLRLSVVVAAVIALLLAAIAGANAHSFAGRPWTNPFLGPVATSTQHGDSESSDTTIYRSPASSRADRVDAKLNLVGGTCASLLIGRDGLVQALCQVRQVTPAVSLVPTVLLIDPDTGQRIAAMTLTTGNIFSGVYGYLDNNDRMVVVDGDQNLLRIGHDRGGVDGAWRLFTADSVSMRDAVEAHCGAPRCDTVVSAMADYRGKVWISTEQATVGVVDPVTRTTRSIALGQGETVANSISVSRKGMSVATTHALYLLKIDRAGVPQIVWRRAYERGLGRKPGQLSFGTGSTPTFFGGLLGTKYVTILDNAAPTENLLVYSTRSGGLVCQAPAIDGSENSPIGVGNSVYVASTYG